MTIEIAVSTAMVTAGDDRPMTLADSKLWTMGHNRFSASLALDRRTKRAAALTVALFVISPLPVG